MWNGVGPRFLKYQKGVFRHIDEMQASGFEWDYRRGARPRPTTPELRLADLDRDGIDAEIVYGCLMINDLDRKSTRLNSSHGYISYAVFCLKKKKKKEIMYKTQCSR